MSEFLGSGEKSLYKEGYNINELKVSYPSGTNRIFSNKYEKSIIDEVISEVDLHIPDSAVIELRRVAEELKYTKYYNLLSLASTKGLKIPYLDFLNSQFDFLQPYIFGSVFHKMTAGQIILPHQDPIRQTSLYLPLAKAGEPYAPLEIYHQDKVFSVGENDNRSCYAWNSKRLHAVYNEPNHKDRYNLQFLVNLPYGETLGLIKKHLGVRRRKDAYLSYDVKQYFSQFSEFKKGCSVLDWGCGPGNFLDFNDDHSIKYVGCDISLPLLNSLKQRWPSVKFLYYNRYNRQYNHTGSKGMNWPLDSEKFDRIILFSVCTHIDLEEIHNLIASLKKHLNQDGQLLFSFFDNQNYQAWYDIIKYRYEFFTEADKALWEKISANKITYFSVKKSGRILMEHNLMQSKIDDCQYFLSFFDPKFLASEIGGELLTSKKTFSSKIMNAQRCLRIY